MARSCNYIILVAFFFTTTLANLTVPELKYLQECANNVGEQCGTQFYNKLFTHNKTTISRDCCYKILQTGYSCHTKMAVFILQHSPDFKNANMIYYLTKSDHIFQKCDRVTEPENSKFLAKCVEKIGSECGDEVFNKLTHDGNITKPCCQKLVKMGEKCHTNMAKALIRTPAMRSIDAIQLLKKNKIIFDQCKLVK
jgi:hypothetical protein